MINKKKENCCLHFKSSSANVHDTPKPGKVVSLWQLSSKNPRLLHLKLLYPKSSPVCGEQIYGF